MDFSQLEIPKVDGQCEYPVVLEPIYPSLESLRSHNFNKIKPEQNPHIQKLVKPHIDSFNLALTEWLQTAIYEMLPVDFVAPTGQRIQLKIMEVNISEPEQRLGLKGTIHHGRKLLPSECRAANTSYVGTLNICVNCTIGDEEILVTRNMGEIPIMLKSNFCHLKNKTPQELIELREEAEEPGGYFIVKGNERMIRMLQVQRRNYPLVLERNSFKQKGTDFSEYGIVIRCVKKDQTYVTNYLHILNNRTAFKFRVAINNYFNTFPLGLLFKALGITSRELYDRLLKYQNSKPDFTTVVIKLLEEDNESGIRTTAQARQAMAEYFRAKLDLPEWYSPSDVTDILFKHFILPHLTREDDKINLLIYMIHKLYHVAQECFALENPDAVMFQEVLLPGQIYLILLKDRIQEWLRLIKVRMLKLLGNEGGECDLNEAFVNKALTKTFSIGDQMHHIMSTGSSRSKDRYLLPQLSGLSIIVERTNFLKFLTQFRAVHRGTFLAESKLTAARLVSPDQFGFICPIHTPDGSLCGVLQHLTEYCEVVCHQPALEQLLKKLSEPSSNFYHINAFNMNEPYCSYMVLLDGKVIGSVSEKYIRKLEHELIKLKTQKDSPIPWTMEIALVPSEKIGFRSQYPGLYLFTTPGRFMRPVINIATQSVEMIGSFQQVYSRVGTFQMCKPEYQTHLELDIRPSLSLLAKLIPFATCNPATRNLYQCQMYKQAMGHPCNLKYRSDNKMLVLETPQSPLVRPPTYDKYELDNYPLGVNGVVAIVSSTTYDMEDALVINKASAERGLLRGAIYKSYPYDLKEKNKDKSIKFSFERDPNNESLEPFLDEYGLPHIGIPVTKGQVICCYKQVVKYYLEKYGGEDGFIHDVKLIDDGSGYRDHVVIKIKIPRPISLGDKFCSRHGQKGVCSRLLPQEEMPFTEDGIVPDILFNPHSLPSRMTVGVFNEALTGLIAADFGTAMSSFPYEMEIKKPAIDFYQELLIKAGFNPAGTHIMYSGKTGQPMNVYIFMGIIYYQRLRHMVEDKYQCRTTGPVAKQTLQPVHGRKIGGGIKFGEMERDAILSHGATSLLKDRILDCSDKLKQPICARCKSNKATISRMKGVNEEYVLNCGKNFECIACKKRDESLQLESPDDEIHVVEAPAVLKYLQGTLNSLNIGIEYYTSKVDPDKW